MQLLKFIFFLSNKEHIQHYDIFVKKIKYVQLLL